MDSHTSRRELLKAMSMIGAGTLALAACGTRAPSPATIVSDVDLIANGVGGLVAALALAHVSVPQSTLDGISAAVADIKANAAAISGALGGNQGFLVGTIMNDLSLLTKLISPFFPVASLAYTLLSAAVSLGQFVYGLVTGVQTGAPQAIMPLAPGARPLMNMSPEEARKALGM